MNAQERLFQRATEVELSQEQIRRYSRHLLIPEVGIEGQQRLSVARVLVVGAGGLGVPVIQYLAAAGIGKLTVVEPDQLEVSNLQRQTLYQETDAGKPKAVLVDEWARRYATAGQVKTIESTLNPENAAEWVASHDLVIDATDNFPARYLINDACFLGERPYVYGSIYQFEGRVTFFWPSEGGPCYRCLHPDPPDPATVPGCGEGGVLGALPGMIGSLMAMEAMKWITGSGELLRGRLHHYDGLKGKTRETLFHRDTDCRLCGDHPTIQSLSWIEDSSRTPCSIAMPEISPAELDQRLSNGHPFQLLDVRQPGEFQMGHLPKAVCIPLDLLLEKLPELGLAEEIVLYCKDMSRTRSAYQLLTQAGFDRVSALEGGYDLWIEEVNSSLPAY